MDFGGRYIYHNSFEKTKHNQSCSNLLDISLRNFLIKMGSLFVSFTFAIVGPAHAFFVHGLKTTTTQVHIPFLEPKSDAEFVGNFMIQSLQSGHGIFLYIGIEVFLSLFENVVAILPILINDHLVDTIELHQKNALTDAQLYWHVKRIVEESQDADE